MLLVLFPSLLFSAHHSTYKPFAWMSYDTVDNEKVGTGKRNVTRKRKSSNTLHTRNILLDFNDFQQMCEEEQLRSMKHFITIFLVTRYSLFTLLIKICTLIRNRSWDLAFHMPTLVSNNLTDNVRNEIPVSLTLLILTN